MRYFHDSLLEANITDALFDLNYIALNAGGNITVGDGTALARESVEITVENQITIQGTPVKFGDAGTVGWYTIEGKDEWTMITFVGKTATVPNLKTGTKVCVEYNAVDDGIKQFTIPAAIIPSEVHMYMTYPLFAGGTNVQTISTSSQVGELIIDVPRFQFSGSMELSMTSSGAATSALSGSALASFTTTNCQDMGTYATVKLKDYGTVWYDDLITMAFADGDSDFTLAKNATKQLNLVGIYKGGITGNINPANVTFASDAQGTASVGDHTGIVSGVADGTTNIVATVTEKPEIEAVAKVTVG